MSQVAIRKKEKVQISDKILVRRLTRRSFLAALGATAALPVLAACQPQVVEKEKIVEKVVTQVVEKVVTQVVEKVVTVVPLTRNLAYIANVKPPTISVIDLDRLTLVDSIVFRDLAKKEQGHFLSVSLDGKQVWIAEDISPDGGFVQVVDLATGSVLQRWDVGAGVANYITRDGKYVFTSSTKTNNINVFDVANVKYVGDFPIGTAPHVIDSSPDGRVLWTNDSKGGNLRSFDISGLPNKLPTPLDTIKIGGTLHALLVHPNGKYVFVGSDESGDNVVDVASKSIVAKVPGKPHNYDISPDRRYLAAGESDYPT